MHTDIHKEFRVDRPHVERTDSGIGTTSIHDLHPALHRLLTGRESTLLDLSGIIGK